MAIYKVGFEQVGIDNVQKSLGKVNNIASETATNVQGITKQFEAQQNVVSNLTGGVNLLGFSFNTVFDTLTALDGKMEGMGNLINTFQSGFNNAAQSGGSLFGSLITGFDAVVAGFRSGAIKMKVILMKSLLPLTLIVAGIYTLRKVWENNIGGIQTRFSKAWGAIKTAWAQFEVAFIKGLKIIEPLFTGFFNYITAIVKPFINAFKQITAAFKGTGSTASDLKPIFTLLGDTLSLTGKIIGGVITIALKPIIFQMQMLGKLVGLITIGWNKLSSAFKQTAVFKSVVGIFERIRDVIGQIIGWIDKIPGINIPTEIKDAVSGNNNTPNNVKNNNQQININTSREINSGSAQGFASLLAAQLDN